MAKYQWDSRSSVASGGGRYSTAKREYKNGESSLGGMVEGMMYSRRMAGQSLGLDPESVGTSTG